MYSLPALLGVVSDEGSRLKVAIIGAGASGLASAQECKARGHDVVIYEQSDRPGGVWAYSAEVETDLLGKDANRRVYSSLYKNLRTNLPSDIMAFKNFPFDETGGGDSSWPRFPHHSCVFQYLLKYIERFELEPLIQFNAKVDLVSPVESGWSVKVNGGEERFDAVMVCSGHFSEPRVPQVEGIEKFNGDKLHSHNYRSPDAFEGKTVALLGRGASGADIASELSGVAQVFWCGFESNKQVGSVSLVPFPERFERDGFVANGENYQVDVVLFCTGYHYHLPFLPDELVTIEDNYVSPLYRDIIPPSQPRLGMIGIPFLVVPFPLYAMQAKWFISQLDGEFDLPTEAEMMKQCEARRASLSAAGVEQRHYHRLGLEQEDYYNLLSKECGAELLPDWFSQLATEAQMTRQANPRRFRDVPLAISRQVHD